MLQRLLNAKHLAQQVQDDKEESMSGGGKEDSGDTEMADADGSSDAGAACTTDGDKSPVLEEERAKGPGGGETVYEQFLSMVFELVEGHLDTSKFEDDCRM